MQRLCLVIIISLVNVMWKLSLFILLTVILHSVASSLVFICWTVRLLPPVSHVRVRMHSGKEKSARMVTSGKFVLRTAHLSKIHSFILSTEVNEIMIPFRPETMLDWDLDSGDPIIYPLGRPPLDPDM